MKAKALVVGPAVVTKTTACPNCGVKHRSLTVEQCKDRAISEAKLQARVLYRARKYGWKTSHAQRGIVGEAEDGHPIIRTSMSPGWPDLACAKVGNRLLFIELKREQADLDPGQVVWMTLLNQTGVRAIIVRPSDLREGRVDAIFRHGDPL